MPEYRGRGVTFNYRPRLKITEQFHSLQGEGKHVGLPCSFVRLTGCGLRCTYCDTPYAFYGGGWQDFDAIESWLSNQGAKLVQITGGEPLHQRAVLVFMDQLLAKGYTVLLETGGHVSLQGVHPEVHIVMDIKTPESGELERMLWENLDLLKSSDELKFVVCSRADLAWSLEQIRQKRLDQRFNVLISPVAGAEEKAAMAEDVINSRLQVRYQLQLHKQIWGDEAGR